MQFAQHGARLAISDLDAEAAAQAAANLTGQGHLGRARNGTDKTSSAAIAADIIAAPGQVDILVNTAGITQPPKLMEIAPENYDAVLDVNLHGTLHMSQSPIPRSAAAPFLAGRTARRQSRNSGHHQSDGARTCAGFGGDSDGAGRHRAGRCGLCLFPASDLSSYVTGSEVDVNGGAMLH